MTKPKHVFRSYFGPSEGMPVAGDFNDNGTWDAAELRVKSGAPGDHPIVGEEWHRPQPERDLLDESLRLLLTEQ